MPGPSTPTTPTTPAIPTTPRDPDGVLADVRRIVVEVIGEDYVSELDIERDTAFRADQDVESIELVALGEALRARYGDGIRLAQWIGDMELDEIIAVHDGDAILMAQKMARELGLGVGISAGANLAGAIALQNRIGDDLAVATVLPDSNKKYLSTDLLRVEPVREHYVAPDVELVGFSAIQRVCGMCYDGALDG